MQDARCRCGLLQPGWGAACGVLDVRKVSKQMSPPVAAQVEPAQMVLGMALIVASQATQSAQCVAEVRCFRF